MWRWQQKAENQPRRHLGWVIVTAEWESVTDEWENVTAEWESVTAEWGIETDAWGSVTEDLRWGKVYSMVVLNTYNTTLLEMIFPRGLILSLKVGLDSWLWFTQEYIFLSAVIIEWILMIVEQKKCILHV